jgi:TIR domain
MIVQHVQPWMSEEDIPGGARWNDQVAAELERTDFGIICLTRATQERPWLLFESGALAKRLKVARVVPLCIDLLPSDLSGPLATFQARSLTEDGMRRLVHDVSAVRKRPAPLGQVDELFDAMWPRLESTRLSEIVRAASQVEASKTVSQPQPEPEEPQEAEVVDLVAALRASVEAAKKRREQAEAVREIQRRPPILTIPQISGSPLSLLNGCRRGPADH